MKHIFSVATKFSVVVILVFFFLTIIFLCQVEEVFALQTYQAEIPNGNKVMRNGQAWAAVGHTTATTGSAITLNPFGRSFKQWGFKWGIELCQEDSDGDGQSNGLELGDPDCIWTKGGTPTRTTDISHPGFSDSMTSATTAASPTGGGSQSDSGLPTGDPTTTAATGSGSGTSPTTQDAVSELINSYIESSIEASNAANNPSTTIETTTASGSSTGTPPPTTSNSIIDTGITSSPASSSGSGESTTILSTNGGGSESSSIPESTTSVIPSGGSNSNSNIVESTTILPSSGGNETTITSVETTTSGSSSNSNIPPDSSTTTDIPITSGGSGSNTGTVPPTNTNDNNTNANNETTTSTTVDPNASTTITTTSTPSPPPNNNNNNAAPSAPAAATVDREAAARGVLTFIAALLSPFIGPSGIFDTTRALAVFTFARCDVQGQHEVLRASTKPPPFPEHLLPFIGTGEVNNSYFRGAVVTSLFIIPLIALLITVVYGVFTARAKNSKKPSQQLGSPEPTTKTGKIWVDFCDYMYHGSTLTTLTVIFALGWDGSVAAVFSMFGTTVESSSGDAAADFILSLLYFVIVCAFLVRIARTIYFSTPTRFFTTPGCIKKKEGKEKPRYQIPDWFADILGGRPEAEKTEEEKKNSKQTDKSVWGRFFIIGDFLWRPGSVRSFRQLRECAALFRRFRGPQDEDRAVMAAQLHAEMAARQKQAAKEAGVTPTTEVKTSSSENTNNNENNNNNNAENKGSENNENANASSSPSKKKTTTTEGGEEEKQKINWKMYSRRFLYTNFFFIEFIFVFVISMLKGLARVSADPSSCYSLSTTSAVFNLLFFLFILAVRPFIVPVRNVLAITSSFFAVVANFIVTSESGDANAAAGLATFAAVIPILCFVIIAVPRLLMRFAWGLQHAPGKQIPLRDPRAPPPPSPEEIEKKKKEKEKQEALDLQSLKPGEVPLLGDASGGGEPYQNLAAMSSHLDPESYNNDNYNKNATNPVVGGLTRLANIFFPPPPETASSVSGKKSESGGSDWAADSFGDDDDEFFGDEDDGDDDVYVAKMLNSSGRSSAYNTAAGTPRDVELRDVKVKVETLQRQIDEVESFTSPTQDADSFFFTSPGARQRQQFAMSGISSPTHQHPHSSNPHSSGVFSPPNSSGVFAPPPSEQKKRTNPRIAQEVALAQLLHQICETRNKAQSL